MSLNLLPKALKLILFWEQNELSCQTLMSDIIHALVKKNCWFLQRCFCDELEIWKPGIFSLVSCNVITRGKYDTPVAAFRLA